jgi:D-alanyl-D-alanine-carboxypeptidase/D-alanyl-D-alanine-endopeptidase
MYLSSGAPGLIFGAVRNGETALAGFGEIRDGSGIEPDDNSIFRSPR